MATNNTGDNTDFYLMGSSEEQLFSSGQQDKVAATNATAGSNSNLLRSTNNGPKDLWSLIKDSKEREKKQADGTTFKRNFITCRIQWEYKQTEWFLFLFW